MGAAVYEASLAGNHALHSATESACWRTVTKVSIRSAHTRANPSRAISYCYIPMIYLLDAQALSREAICHASTKPYNVTPPIVHLTYAYQPVFNIPSKSKTHETPKHLMHLAFQVCIQSSKSHPFQVPKSRRQTKAPCLAF
jgi:hypothetical protein